MRATPTACRREIFPAFPAFSAFAVAFRSCGFVDVAAFFVLAANIFVVLIVNRVCHCARRDGHSSTQYPFLAHPALDPRGFAFAVQPDWADLVAERDLVASGTPALGAGHLGDVASLGMEICVPTVRTVP